jgi:DNA-binding IclR family transcriptional regulator
VDGAALRTNVGTRRPLGIGAGGMALLAAMCPAEAEALVRSNEPAYRSFGRDAPTLLRRRLEAAQRDGFALAESFFASGILGIGVVVPPTHSAPPLAISVVGRASRLPRGQCQAVALQIRAAAEEVARCITG